MYRKLFFVLFCFLIAVNFACNSNETANNNVNQVKNIKLDQSNLPPGFSASPMNTNGATTPGIPDPKNANVLSKGATPTPGIPDPKNIGKTPMPKGTPPIPGIPDEETLKKQMNQVRDPNEVNRPPANSQVNFPQQKSPIDRKRKAGNPQ